MEDEKTQFWILGIIVASITGIYGIIVKHLFNHVSVKSIDELKKHVQYRDTCTEIVKRLDENNGEVHKKLDRIIDWIEKK